MSLMAPPNGLPLSCAAPIDQESNQAKTSFQNGDDLGAAQRRQLQRLVGPLLLGMCNGKRR